MNIRSRVLFVDDEQQLLDMISRFFRTDERLSAETVTTPAECFRKLEQERYDIVVSDWKMPEMNGGDLLQRVSREHPDCSLGLMTGVPDAGNIAFAVNRAGVDRVFLKPVKMSELRTGLIELLEERTLAATRQAAATIAGAGSETDNSRLSIKGFVRGLLAIAQSFDPNMVAHTYRVASYATNLYELYMNRPNNPRFSPENVKNGRRLLTYAALLHDIGKIFVDRRVLDKDTPLHSEQVQLLKERLSVLKNYLGTRSVAQPELAHLIADSIAALDDSTGDHTTWQRIGGAMTKLSKATASIREEISLPLVDTDMAEALFNTSVGTLTKTERRAVESHVLYSERLVAGLPWPTTLKKVPTLCRHHHERLDGSGYPDGIVDGPDFSDELRVLTVADVYDALTDPSRSYRPPISPEAAIQHLQEEAEAGRLDPGVVRIAAKYQGVR